MARSTRTTIISMNRPLVPLGRLWFKHPVPVMPSMRAATIMGQ